jgi:Domain of unknown function (DUF5615)
VDPDLGLADAQVWEFANQQSAVVLTGNAVDFERLAQTSEHHAGLVLVYRDNDPRRDMTAGDIVRAISRIEGANPGGIEGQILAANQFRW